MKPRPVIAVSACLTGAPVRFDGGHKRDGFVDAIAPRFFDLIPYCPELEIGLGAPRPAIQLRRIDGRIRLVDGRDPSLDHTDRMVDLAAERAERFAGLDGLIVKKGSPSCGVERVPVVVNRVGMRERSGAGLFTAELQRRLPLLPVEEEGRLHDPLLREGFLERVYALHRWRSIDEESCGAFVEFHTRHKLMLMARGAHLYAELGRIVAGTTRGDLAERRGRYIRRFMEVLALRPSPGRNINVLTHCLGYFKRVLDGDDKQELLELFEAYRERRVALIGPLLLLRHHLRRFPNDWLAAQYYLNPYPEGLAPRAFT